MLFNSYDFLFGFLPIVLLAHHLLVTRVGGRAAWAWLVAASLVFYGWFYWPYLGLLLGSMAVNYGLGRVVEDPTRRETTRARTLTLGIVLNLLLLGGFKYAGFFDTNVQLLLGIDLDIPQVALPLAISFFTFQQIAYLVDARQGRAPSHDALEYAAFVSFYPQLVAGPIVHHREIIPQVQAAKAPTWSDRSVGATIFVLGLAKKVWIADTLAPVADHIFADIHAGHGVSVLAAWSGILAFFFQVYFDFSGYSDMAVGLARMIGLRLPVNFDAPYRSASIIEFWERWHITLSRFLRDYLYIPLGGSRRGSTRRWINLMVTMLLGGLWHGASWTFVAWGGVNGLYLMINHAWRGWRGGVIRGGSPYVLSRALTFIALVVSYTYFRAESFSDATTMQLAMAGVTDRGWGTIPPWLAWTFLGVFLLTQLAPTSQRWLERYEPVLHQAGDTLRWPPRMTWRPTLGWSIVIGLLFVACLPALERADAFVYWAF